MSASINSHVNDNDKESRLVDWSTPRALNILADEIRAELDALQEHDVIHSCGRAALAILRIRPLEALQLAQDHVRNVPYRDVRGCWLRLYEDASLWRAAELLAESAHVLPHLGTHRDAEDLDWMSEVVSILDLALVVSGGQLRGQLFEAIFANLESFVGISGGIPTSFSIDEPDTLRSENLVATSCRPSLEQFQIHLDGNCTPLLLTHVMDEWPAMEKWQDPTHLLRLTLGGRRCVPIEIGETYTHVNWRQEIMTIGKFMHDYLLPGSSPEIGYLGQHNLFHQIPALQQDIRTPDYCFSAPPDLTPASRLGLPPVALVDEPQKNVWLGPKGTRTPLHTDPYHNIFCQVVGYKYVRLYPPEATGALYPRGVDENGINESNTSEVEIRLDRERGTNVTVDEKESFPLFLAQADYRESIVGPGQCLYIPAGWWHYIESLTVSYSVSFWWN